MDGDQVFETIVSLKNLGINDVCELIDTSTFKYENFTDLMCKMAHDMWSNALLACKVAEKYGVNTFWYAKLKQAASIRKNMIMAIGCNIIYIKIWNIFFKKAR